MLKYISRLVSYLSSKVGSEFKQTFQCLQGRNFRIYSIGQFISLCGAWMQSIALSWLVYRLTDSALMLGVVAFASSLPMLFLTYFGGMAADRFDRRKLMMCTQSSAMANALLLYVLTSTNTINIYWVLGLGAFLGCITALETPVRQAFVVDLLEDKKQLVNTIGVNAANNNTARIVGPMLAAFVIAGLGEKICFLFNALTYVAMLTALYNIRIVKPDGPAAKEPASDASVAEFRVMARELFKDRNLKGIIALTMIMAVFGLQYQTLLPVVAKVVLHGEADLYGFLSAIGGVGALIGSLTLASRGSTSRIKSCIAFTCLGLSTAIMVVSLSTVVALSMVAVGFAGFCLNWQMGGSNSLVQSTVNPAIRGRVMAIYSSLMFGITPFANLLSGWFAERCGVSNVLAVCSLVIVSSAGLYVMTRDKSETR